ncbi:MAG: hypothetical protein AAF533_02365 [Acidobacteriota bacterium]
MRRRNHLLGLLACASLLVSCQETPEPPPPAPTPVTDAAPEERSPRRAKKAPAEPTPTPSETKAAPTRTTYVPQMETVVRVREERIALTAPDPNAEPLLRFIPGDVYPIADERGGWIRLGALADDLEAWVRRDEVLLVEEPKRQWHSIGGVVSPDGDAPERAENVFTQADLATSRGSVTVLSGSGTSSSSNSDDDGWVKDVDDELAAIKEQEKIWRTRAQRIRSQLQETGQRIAELQRESSLAASYAIGVPAGGEFRSLATVRSELRSKVEHYEALQKSWDALEVEARKAGAQPGWLR